MHIKEAYELGVAQALKDIGLEKLALLPQMLAGATKFLGANPTLGRMAIGAGLGGVAGGMSDVGVGRGMLAGGAAGLGAGAGAQWGRKAFGKSFMNKALPFKKDMAGAMEHVISKGQGAAAAGQSGTTATMAPRALLPAAGGTGGGAMTQSGGRALGPALPQGQQAARGVAQQAAGQVGSNAAAMAGKFKGRWDRLNQGYGYGTSAWKQNLQRAGMVGGAGAGALAGGGALMATSPSSQTADPRQQPWGFGGRAPWE